MKVALKYKNVKNSTKTITLSNIDKNNDQKNVLISLLLIEYYTRYVKSYCKNIDFNDSNVYRLNKIKIDGKVISFDKLMTKELNVKNMSDEIKSGSFADSMRQYSDIFKKLGIDEKVKKIAADKFKDVGLTLIQNTTIYVGNDHRYHIPPRKMNLLNQEKDTLKEIFK